jgi:putative membrane protein
MDHVRTTDAAAPRRGPLLLALAAATVAMLAASGWRPHDRLTWLMEVLPVIVALPLLVVTHRRHPLTTLLYVLAFAHSAVLMLGGAYTYARVPLGFDLQAWLGLDRNPYDKIGHFMQGFVPAIAAREIFVRGAYVRGRRMLAFVVLCVVLAVSATYELIEWAAALAMGEDADAFLGTQGDSWDTQSDMLFACVGGVAALLVLRRLHDRQLARMGVPRG